MTRLRLGFGLVALFALFLTGTPYQAATEETPPPSTGAALLDGGQCSQSQASTAEAVDAASPLSGFILCTCKFCKANPDIDCQISPDGYSIRCKDWYDWHC